MTNIIRPLYEKVQFKESSDDTYMTVYSRSHAVAWACKLGLKDCVDNSVRLYRAWMDDPRNDQFV